MKKVISVVIISAIALTLLLAGCGGKTEENVVNVYNWGEYIDMSVLKDFEEQTGIKVNYSTFNTNEDMYNKIKGGGSNYDVIIPSDYMISRMISEGLLEKLDYSNIPNIAKIDDAYRYQSFDPNNEYSVPYTWGTVGIIYDATVVDGEVTSWEVLFDPQYSGQILMFDNPRDAFGIALKYLGYSINSTNTEELDEAYELLREQKPLVQAYVMDQIFTKLEGGEAAIGPYYAGDYYSMLESNPNLEFCLPDEGSNVFIDAMCIPKGAQHKKNAELFINFMCETEVCLKNTEATYYSTPSKEAIDQLPDDVKYDEVAYPDADVLARCEAFVNLPKEAQDYYDNLWIKLKT